MNKGYINLYVMYWFQYWRSLKDANGEHMYTAAQAYDTVVNDPFIGCFDEPDVCLG